MIVLDREVEWVYHGVGLVNQPTREAHIIQKKNTTYNTSRVLRTIWTHEQISRVDIARNTGLDKSTITNIVSSLLAQGVVKETSEGAAGPLGGRRPVNLTVNREFGQVLGVEIQPEYISALVVNLYGEIIRKRFVKGNFTAENLVPAFVEVYEDLQREAGREGSRIIGAGVGVSGIVNPYTGVILQSIPLGVRDELPFFEKIADRVDIPVFIENDANACAWGELAFHKNEELKNFLTILIEFRERESTNAGYTGVAVGFGIVIHGRVYYGEDFSAGEFKSVFAGQSEPSQFSLSESELLRIRYDSGIFSRFVDELSVNVSLLVNTFNFRKIVLIGSIQGHTEELSLRIRKEIQKNWSYPGTVNCDVQSSSVGEVAVAYGAAGMFLEHLFKFPEMSSAGAKHLPSGVELLSGCVHQ